MKKVALVYDRVNSQGGAEKVLQELHALYPDAPLYTSVYESARAPWADGWDVRPSWLQKFPFLRTRHQLIGWLMPLVFETLDLREYDLVISVTSEFCKGVVTLPHQLHVSYILTPTRYLWSHTDESLQMIPILMRPVARLLFSLLQRYDRVIAHRPDVLISISQLVAARVKKYYGLESSVVYPPYQALPKAQMPSQVPPWNEFALTWGRLVRYKRFSHVIRACVEAQTPLVIVGSGPDFSRLKTLAEKLDPQKILIFFAGYQNDEHLSWYLEHARVSIFPQLEDFGIASLEARLAGTSIITQKSSGSSEIIGTAKGVYYLDGENDENIVAYLKEIWKTPANRLDIRRQARQYAGARWRHDWSSAVNATQRSTLKRDQDKGNRKGL